MAFFKLFPLFFYLVTPFGCHEGCHPNYTPILAGRQPFYGIFAEILSTKSDSLWDF